MWVWVVVLLCRARGGVLVYVRSQQVVAEGGVESEGPAGSVRRGQGERGVAVVGGARGVAAARARFRLCEA